MKISFVWDWPNYLPQTITWKDGLARAIQILSQKHELQFLTCDTRDSIIAHDFFDIHATTDVQAKVKEFDPDVILMWGDCTRPNASKCAELGKPMALCFAGGQVDGPTERYFDHFFVESEVYKERFEARGQSVSTAFGTNTDLFKPFPKQQKIFDVIKPATYARWKRHDVFAETVKGLRSVTAGYIIPAEEYCADWCRDAGSLVLPHVSAETLKTLFAASKCCLITSHWTGGSQRTVLEAMSMNIPLVVTSDSDKTSEYVRECGYGLVVDPDPKKLRQAVEEMMNTEVDTRPYVLEKWSEIKYADALEAGLQKICASAF